MYTELMIEYLLRNLNGKQCMKNNYMPRYIGINYRMGICRLDIPIVYYYFFLRNENWVISTSKSL